jgi:hypothetical protein
MKKTCLVNAKVDEKGIAVQARNDRSFRMKNKNKIFLFCLILIYSCSEKKETLDFLDTEIKTVKSKLYNADLIMSSCDNMQVINSKFYFFYARPDIANIIARESDGKEIGMLGKFGQGPGEYIFPVFTGCSEKGDSVYIYDFPKHTLLSYVINEQADTVTYSFVEKIKQPSELYYARLLRLKNGYYVGLRHEAKTTEKLLTLFDSQLNEIKTFGESPIKLNVDFRDYKYCYDNSRISVYGNSVFFATARFGFLAGYDISDNGDVVTRFEKMIVKPTYHYGVGVVFDAENKEGFYDIKASKDKLFVTYGGKTKENLRPDGGGMHPETFAVFNHDGVLISRVKMNSIGSRICISGDEKWLYLCVREPEYNIEAYKIADFLK